MYASQPEPKKIKERERYASQPEPKKERERERYAAFSALYARNLQNRKKIHAKAICEVSLSDFVGPRRGYYHSALAKTAAKVLNRAKAWAKNKQVVKKAARSYSLHEPNQLTRERYVKLMRRTISKDASIGKELVSAFVASNLYNTSKVKASRLANAVTHIAVRKILSKILKQETLCR